MIRVVVVCVVVVCVVVALATAHPVTFFTDCGSETGTLTSLDVTPCPSNPCQFPRGKTVTTTFNITANADVTSAKTDVHVIVFGFKSISVQIPNSDACSSIECPVNTNQTVTYTNGIFITKTTPKVPLTLKVKVETKDQNGKHFICVEYPMKIVD